MASKRYFHCSVLDYYTNISSSHNDDFIVLLFGLDLDDLRQANRSKISVTEVRSNKNDGYINSNARMQPQEFSVTQLSLWWINEENFNNISVWETWLYNHYQNQHNLNTHWLSIVSCYCFLCWICVLSTCEWFRTKKNTSPLLFIWRTLGRTQLANVSRWFY